MRPTRSPRYFNQAVNQYTQRVRWEIDVQKKTSNSVETVHQESITKEMPSSDFDNLWLDVSPIIRDWYTHSPILLATLQAGGVIKSRNDEILQAVVDVSTEVSAGPSVSAQSTIKCLDGYSRFRDGQNFTPSNSILLSNDTYKVSSDGYFIVPIWVITGAEGLTVDGQSVTKQALDSPLDSLQYVIIRAADYTGDIVVIYDGNQILIEKEPACKYPVYEIQFINRFGVVESIDFRSKAKESISVEKSSFHNAHTDGTSYDIHRHQKRDYQKIGSKKISIETDYLNEGYNETIEELMMSEKVWMRSGADTIPVNVDSSSLEYKTRIVDKLISYKLTFEYADYIINNV